jgi:O-antigen ligase
MALFLCWERMRPLRTVARSASVMAESSSAAARVRPSAGEWIQFALLAASLVWTTLCLGGYRPETMVVTSALNGALLAVHLLGRAMARTPAERAHLAGWLLLPFLAYAALNVVSVSPVRWLGWQDWLGWAQAALVFWVVLNGLRSAAVRTALLAVLVALALAAVVLAAYQRFVRPDWLMMGRIQADQFIGRASGPFGIPNSLAALLNLVLPVLAVLTVRRGAGAASRVFWGYATAVCAFGLVLTVSRGAWLALIGAVVIAFAFAGRSAPWRRLARAALAVVVFGVALWTLYATTPGVRARIDAFARDRGELTRPVMWRGAWRLFAAHPLAGSGAGSYNVLFERYRPPNYQDEPRWAHNDYLNTLADYGLAGYVLAFGAGGAIAWRTLRRLRGMAAPAARAWIDDPRVSGAIATGLGAFALQLLVDFNLKIPALAMSAAALAALVVRARWPAPERVVVSAPRRWAAALGVALAAGVTIFWILPVWRAEAGRYAARQTIEAMAQRRARAADEAGALREVRTALARSVALDPANAQAWADAAYATALWGHVEPARLREFGAEAQRQAERAIALSPVVAEFWIRLGVALDLQGRRLEAGRAFVHALQLAPARATVWYYQAFHLALDRHDPGRALAAVDFCLRLDPGNPDALALRQRLAPSSTHP